MSTSLKTACLSVGLVSAWAAAGDAMADATVRIEPSWTAGTVDHARLMISGSGSGALGTMFRNLSLSGLTYLDFTTTLSAGGIGSGYAMIGILHNSGPDRLMLTSPGLTLIVGVAFEEAFPGFSEQLLLDQLRTDNLNADAFLTSQFSRLRTGLGSGSDVLGYSVGERIGSMTVGVFDIPAPSSLVGGLTMLVLAARRRR